MAGLLGREVLTKEYETIRIRIAFHPLEEKFEFSIPPFKRTGPGLRTLRWFLRQKRI